MANIIENLFSYIDIFCNLFPLVLFFIYYRSVGDVAGLRIMIFYAISNIVINGIIILTSTSNFFLYESQTLVEYILFNWFIYSQISRKKARNLIIILGVAYVIFFFAFSFFSKDKNGFDSVPVGVEAIIILGFSFYYLYERMNDTTTLFIYNTYQFWVILGIVLYLAGSFFIYVFADYLRNSDRAMVERLWRVTNVFSILKSVLFCVAILVHAKPSKETLQYNLETSRLN